MARKKVTLRKRQPDSPIEVEKKESVVLTEFEDNVRPVVKPNPSPIPAKAKAEVCSCGGDVGVNQCEACGWTWCRLCLKGVRACPQCGLEK